MWLIIRLLTQKRAAALKTGALKPKLQAKYSTTIFIFSELQGYFQVTILFETFDLKNCVSIAFSGIFRLLSYVTNVATSCGFVWVL